MRSVSLADGPTTASAPTACAIDSQSGSNARVKTTIRACGRDLRKRLIVRSGDLAAPAASTTTRLGSSSRKNRLGARPVTVTWRPAPLSTPAKYGAKRDCGSIKSARVIGHECTCAAHGFGSGGAHSTLALRTARYSMRLLSGFPPLARFKADTQTAGRFRFHRPRPEVVLAARLAAMSTFGPCRRG